MKCAGWPVAFALWALILLGSPAPGAGMQEGGEAVESPSSEPKWRAVRAPDGDRDAVTARLYGALLYTKISVDFSEAPAREAIGALRAAVGVPLIGRFRDDRPGYGVDPATPITLHVSEAPALDVLEEIGAQCARDAGECTWQIRKGFIEFGTKRRLSVPAASEARTYYIADVIMDIPRSGGEEDQPGVAERRRREEVALDLIGEIVENIEPDAWDYGQVDYYDPEDLAVRYEIGSGERKDDEGAEAGAAPGAAPAEARDAAVPRRYVSPRKIAIIRYWRDVLIIHAPDYIHRQIGGYPEPIPPPGAEPAAGQ
jgi:hypothetical protein